MRQHITPDEAEEIICSDCMSWHPPPPSCLLPFADRACWVGWTLKRKYGSPSRTRSRSIPTPKAAAVNNPRTWGTLEAAQRLARAPALPGIGIVSAGVPELVFLDLDDCVDPVSGAITNATAQRLLDECGHSYGEITPSRTELRIIGTAPDIQASFGHKATHREAAAYCIRVGNLSDWETAFCLNVARFRRVSDKQLAVLRRLARRTMEAAQ